MLRRVALHAHRLAHSRPNIEQIGSASALLRHTIDNGSMPQSNACCLCSARGISRDFEEERGGPTPHQSKNMRVVKLAEEILQLNLLELSDLTEIFQEKLGIPNIGAMNYGAPAPAQGGSPQAAASEAPAEEQTDFDVKLDSFEAAAKIKVIKEIRALSDLGLKEAKELVEKAPVTIKTGLKKEEADELKKKLEAVGGKVSLV